MARQKFIEPTKTYKTERNAIRAVEKYNFPDSLTYIIVYTEDGRCYPMFINCLRECLQHGVHFTFVVIG